MDLAKVKTIVVFILVTLFALYLGVAAAMSQVEALSWMGGGLLVTACLLLGRRIWLLIPFTNTLGLVIPLPGNLSIEFIAYVIVLGYCSLLFLIRKLPLSFQITDLEFWCFLFLLCVFQVYIRNPVGLNLFGGGSVGGKPYLLFGVTVLISFLISVMLVGPHEIIWYVRLSVLGAFLNFSIGLVGKLVPSAGYYLGASYATDRVPEVEVAEGAATRVSFVRQISSTMALWISSRISPLKACFHPLWLLLILCTLAAAAYSGFRSQLIGIGFTLFFGIYYRSGSGGVAIASVLGVVALALLAITNQIMPLPPNVQRSLTFLPGTWEERYREDTDNSTEWRITMWKEALLTDKWIQNKWLGDGLGFTKEEYDRTLYMNSIKGTKGSGGLARDQENMMISGVYHSGPVQTIRTVGYIGLLVLLIGMARMVVHAHRQIERCRDTEWFPVALFLCMPTIIGPLVWAFIFGTFDSGGQTLFMGAALVRLLEKNLPLPAYVIKRKQHFIYNRQGAQPMEAQQV